MPLPRAQQPVVQEIASATSATVTLQATLNDAKARMIELGTGTLYLVDASGRLHGVICDYDLLKAEAQGIGGDSPASEMATPHVASVSVDTPIEQVRVQFHSACCQQLAVVDCGRLCGVLTRLAILSYREPEAERPTDQAVPSPHFRQVPQPADAAY